MNQPQTDTSGSFAALLHAAVGDKGSADPSTCHWDPHPAWLTALHHVRENWERSLRRPGNENFDSPATRTFEAEIERLETALAETPATTIDGAAAQLEYAMQDIGEPISSTRQHRHMKLFANVLQTLKGEIA